MAVGFSDSNYKTFLAPNNVGISTFGAADIQGDPTAGYIESYLCEHFSDGKVEVDDVPPKLLGYFRQSSPLPPINFIVAGYKYQNGQKQQQVLVVDTQGNEFKQVIHQENKGLNGVVKLTYLLV